ncbi:MAG TPA: class I SAM-dependent methyltransferase [Burkholderiales bacterium]|nr:class I SAM-dependent methyltransferase [Burkholderiales bacterium]
MLPNSKTSYDEVPYESFPVPGTHPDRLATLAWLAGVQTPALETCRVLELGCAAGGNLIPMAVELPRAQFTGVDLSAAQVADGDAVIRALQLGNVRLIAGSVTDIDDSFGQFDYVIAHGIYSWVPNAVQEKILEVCNRNLAPQGVAYVSYNTLPGWRTRGLIRDLMRYHALQFTEPDQRVAQARAMLDFLARGVPDENSAYGKLLRSELELLHSAPDYYILHEHLEELNEPLYFHEFIERAQRHGLQYLADAEIASTQLSRFPPPVADTVRRLASDVIRQEQLMDFLSNRTFRQTLLMHAEQSFNRLVTVERMQALWVASPAAAARRNPDLAEGIVEKFCTPAGMCVSTPRAITKSALLTLSTRWPAAVAGPELTASAYSRLNPLAAKPPRAEDAETLAGDLLHSYAAGIVELHVRASPFSIEPGTRPCASPLARYQAERGTRITTLRHDSIVVPDPIRALLPLLDGSRTLDEIFAAVGAQGRGSLSAFADPELLKTAVGQIARNTLIPA